MVADWHALMSEYVKPSDIQANIFDNVADWISCGINPKKSTIFVQSEVKEHLELYMIFSCLVPLGWLERCPTYKEQLRELDKKDINTYGFLGYPVLQAADILLYKADCVPVGEDQLPHLELTREIGRRFNHLYKSVFKDPHAILTQMPRLLGLDGRKMSKSYGNTLDLSDTDESIKEKVRTMFTDPKRIKFSDVGHPKECNIYSYYNAFSPSIVDEVWNWCTKATVGCTDCKKRLADALVKKLSPIHEKRKELLKDKNAIKKILKQGSDRAREVASITINEVKKAMELHV
jgi:tryptophanyl-tRNA synthetase